MRRASRNIDVTRLSQAIQRPGADTRAWVAFGTVAEIVFDTEDGITVGVQFEGGPLDGEGPVACALLAPFARAAAIGAAPFAVGDQAVVVIPDGELNSWPVIVGFFPTEDQPPPETVAGEPLTQELVEGNHITADATKGFIADVASVLVYSPEVTIKALQSIGVETITATVEGTAQVSLVSPAVRLASQGAAQSYVRGEDLASALSTLIAAFQTWAGVLGAPPPATPLTTGIVAGANTALFTAFSAFNAAVTAALSQKIKGE